MNGLTRSAKKALGSYLLAIKENLSLEDVTDEHVCEHINEYGSEYYEEDRFPTLDTWLRYLRSGRKALGRQKNQPRHGRPFGKSIVPMKFAC
jgi:hypothetical protein